MAVLYIKEYASLEMTSQGLAPIPSEPLVAEQTVAIGVAAASSALNAKTKFVRLNADAACAVSFTTTSATASGTGTAAGTGHRMSAGATELIGVGRLPAGSTISVIATT